MTRLSAHLPHSPHADTGPAAPPLPSIRLAAPGPATTIVLADHLAQPTSSAVRAALNQVDEVAIGQAADADDPAVQAAFDFAGVSELLLLHQGVLVARRDTCGPHHVDELVALARRADAVPVDSTQPLAPAAARSIALQLHDAEALLVPPNATRLDYVALNPRSPRVQIPTGWSLLARLTANQSALDSLPSAEVDILELIVPAGTDPEAIAALRGWPRLNALTAYLRQWDEQVISALSQLVALRRLTVAAQPPEDVDLESLLRTALPRTIVNNGWDHPAFSGARCTAS